MTKKNKILNKYQFNNNLFILNLQKNIMKKSILNSKFFYTLLFIVSLFIAFNLGAASITNGVFHDLQSIETYPNSGVSVDSNSNNIIDLADALAPGCTEVYPAGAQGPFPSGGQNIFYLTLPTTCFNQNCHLIWFDPTTGGTIQGIADLIQINVPGSNNNWHSSPWTSPGTGFFATYAGNVGLNGDMIQTNIVAPMVGAAGGSVLVDDYPTMPEPSPINMLTIVGQPLIGQRITVCP
jgi:hypothetical protein